MMMMMKQSHGPAKKAAGLFDLFRFSVST